MLVTKRVLFSLRYVIGGKGRFCRCFSENINVTDDPRSGRSINEITVKTEQVRHVDSRDVGSHHINVCRLAVM